MKGYFRIVGLCGGLLLTLFLQAAWAHGGHQSGTPAACEQSGGPALACANAPTPAFGPDGRLWITWYDRGHLYVQHSDDLGRRFSEPMVVNRVPEPVDDQGEDRPRIAFGPAGEIYLVWTRKLDQPYTGHIRFSRSTDGGRSFSTPVNVNDDAAVIAHRFPTFRVNPRGEIFVAWIDKRDLEAAKAAGEAYTGAALYYAVSQDGGQTFSASRKLADHSCECCRIAMALDEQGLPVIFYRHVFPGQIRDHALIRYTDPHAPRRPVRATFDDWVIRGCPHHGPALAVENGVMHQAWFTAGAGGQGLRYARVTAQDDQPEPLPVGPATAAHPALVAHGARVVLAWKAFVDGRTQVAVQQSPDGGRNWREPEVLAVTEGASDHPLLVRDGSAVYLSWQTAREGYRLLPVGGPEE